MLEGYSGNFCFPAFQTKWALHLYHVWFRQRQMVRTYNVYLKPKSYARPTIPLCEGKKGFQTVKDLGISVTPKYHRWIIIQTCFSQPKVNIVTFYQRKDNLNLDTEQGYHWKEMNFKRERKALPDSWGWPEQASGGGVTDWVKPHKGTRIPCGFSLQERAKGGQKQKENWKCHRLHIQTHVQPSGYSQKPASRPGNWTRSLTDRTKVENRKSMSQPD